MTANQERANCARLAVDAFALALEQCGRGGGDGNGDQTTLSDLLTDLRHWADLSGLDWDRADRLASMNYEAEADPAHEEYGGPKRKTRRP